MKRLTPGTVTVGVMSILLGLVAAYSVRRYLEPAAPRGEPMTGVVVPRVNLPKYARIREQDIEVLQIPTRLVPERVVGNPSRALFRLVKDTILAGQPIVEDKLYEVGKIPTLADQLPPGYRAVTVSVDPNNALDGVLVPEAIVDISLTVRGDHPEVGGMSTLTLLRRVKVLATNRDRYPTEERLNQGIRSVTVAVTPEQANKLILAQRFGSLSVTLRGALEDEQLAHVEDADIDMVNPAEVLGLSPVPPRRQKKAQIYRGGSLTEVVFDDDRISEAHRASEADELRGPSVLPASNRRDAEPANAAPRDNDRAEYPPRDARVLDRATDYPAVR
ncbi:MAG: Flp pilus assembly protein CpaB [Pirellulales bacterium]